MNVGYCEDCDDMVWTDRPVAWGVEHGLANPGHIVRTPNDCSAQPPD